MLLHLTKGIAFCRTWRWLIFAFLIAIILIPKVPQVKKSIKRQLSYLEEGKYPFAVDRWLKSVKCYRDTGMWLAFYMHDVSDIYEGKYERKSAFADFSLGNPADDPGHALLLTLKAKIQARDMEYEDVAELNLYIKLVGGITLLVIIFGMRLYFLFFLLLIFIKKSFFKCNWIDHHITYIGVTSLAMILPVVVIGFHTRFLKSKGAFCFGLVGALSLGLATWIRGTIGMMGLIVTLCVVAGVLWMQRKELKRATFTLLLALFAFFAAGAAHWAFMIRDQVSPVEVSKFTQQKSLFNAGHGISHTLYVGLGVVDNPWGIEWSDSNGEEAVKRYDSSIPYISPEYFNAIQKLYFNIIKEHPIEVAKIYWEKLKLHGQLPYFSKYLPTTLLMLILLYFFQRRLITFNLALVGFLFMGLYILQGVLAHPLHYNASPMILCLVIIVGAFIEGAFLFIQERVFRGIQNRLKINFTKE